MITLQERIERDDIACISRFVDTTTDNQGWEHHAYRVTLRRFVDGHRRQMTVSFKVGIALNDSDVTALTVLHTLVSDASALESSGGYLDYCSDYGMDPDGPSSRKLYEAVKRQSERLEKFLGDDFMRYLNDTDWQI